MAQSAAATTRNAYKARQSGLQFNVLLVLVALFIRRSCLEKQPTDPAAAGRKLRYLWDGLKMGLKRLGCLVGNASLTCSRHRSSLLRDGNQSE